MISEIGDNLRQHDHYTLHLIREPEIDGSKPGTLTPDWTIRFRYEDGAHNAEALAIVGNQILIITKEPLGSAGHVPGGIYGLALPTPAKLSAEHGSNLNETPMLVANRLGTMAAQSISLEARLAARLASVDLNHNTALDIDQINNRLWVLTYRHVIRFDRAPEQSWAQALAGKGIRMHAHALAQAESMTVTDDALLWFSSEGANAPLWVLPPQ